MYFKKAMGKKLTEAEIRQIVSKLREQYGEYAKKHGASFFSKEAFEARYREAIKSGIDLEVFAYAEVRFFEELKKKLADTEERQRIRTEKPFTKKVEQYIEELELKWRKYPAALVDAEISEEAQHFTGALEDFYSGPWLTAGIFVRGSDPADQKEYGGLTEEVQRFVRSTRDRLPYEAELYLLNSGRMGIEKANMLFLRSAAALLKKMNRFLKRLCEKAEEGAIRLAPKTAEADRAGIMNSENLAGICGRLEEIIADFRFQHLV